jgi:hypothetical protein
MTAPDRPVCAWCGVRMASMGADEWVCPAGCALPGVAGRSETCVECGQGFVTGLRFQVLCAACDAAETGARRESYRNEPETDTRKARLRERLGVTGDVDE